MKHTLSVLTENHAGVLSKVSGLFTRRGFNIDSLAVGVTEDPAISRMTIVVHGDDAAQDADHVRGHADAGSPVRAEGIHQVLGRGQVLPCRRRRRAGQEQRVVYNLSNHASPFPRRRLWRALFPVSIPPGGRAVKKIAGILFSICNS